MAVSRLSQHSIQNAFPKGNTVWDGTTATSSFDSLGSVIVSSATSTVTFSNIPQTYTHLHIRCLTRGSSGSTCPVYLRVNSDSGTNYSTHQLLGNGSTAYADGHANASYILDGWGGFQSWSGDDLANTFGVGIIDILDYTNTSKFKTARALWARENNASTPVTGRIVFESGAWRNTNAITTLTFATDASTYGITWAPRTEFSLYGVK
jgi:hypothetical protein